MQGEDLPYATNTVDLSPSIRDARGFPVARVTYQPGHHELAASKYHGKILQSVELHFSNPGKVVLDLQLMSNRHTVNSKGDLRYTLGFKFMSLPGSAENTLQRLITQLEIKRRSLSR